MKPINARYGFCIRCKGNDDAAARDALCQACNAKLYLKDAKFCFRCQPKCAVCRIMRVTDKGELCQTCLNQQTRELKRREEQQASHLSMSQNDRTGGL